VTVALFDRTAASRDASLRLANQVRFARSRMKKQLRAGLLDPVVLVETPPDYLESMKTSKFLASLPWWGPAKARKTMQRARISDAKTIGGLSPTVSAPSSWRCSRSGAVRDGRRDGAGGGERGVPGAVRSRGRPRRARPPLDEAGAHELKLLRRGGSSTRRRRSSGRKSGDGRGEEGRRRRVVSDVRVAGVALEHGVR
jgi:hypothetical protein